MEERIKTNSGFTLLELLIAIVIGGMIITMAYTTYIGFHRSVVDREKKNFHRMVTEIFSKSLKNQLRKSSTLIEVGPQSIKFENESGKVLHYVFEEDHLFMNDTILDSNIIDFLVQVEGPFPGQETDTTPDYDYWSELDIDGNGILDLDELDEDGSGYLEIAECNKIGLLQINVRWLPHYKKEREIDFEELEESSLTETFWIHPRNRLFNPDIHSQEEEFFY